MTARLVPVEQLAAHSGLYARGALDVSVFAGCTCGWSSTAVHLRRSIMPAGLRESLEAERAGHEQASGHGEDRTVVPVPVGLHVGCGFYHGLNDDCPVGTDSPRGLLLRVLEASASESSVALDRLAAAAELRAWLDEQELMAVIGARLARCSWEDVGGAMALGEPEVWRRFGPLIHRYEVAGLLPGEEIGPPHPDRPQARPR